MGRPTKKKVVAPVDPQRIAYLRMRGAIGHHIASTVGPVVAFAMIRPDCGVALFTLRVGFGVVGIHGLKSWVKFELEPDDAVGTYTIELHRLTEELTGAA